MQRIALALLCLSLSTLALRAQTKAPPETAYPDSPWSAQVAQQLERVEYEFQPVAGDNGVWSAPNRSQEFRSRVSAGGIEVFPRETSADGVGAEWKLELRTTSFGRVGDEHELAAASLSANNERIELDHGALVEWFENRSQGLEQGWTIATRPDGDAPLWIGLDFKGLSLRIDDGAQSGVLVDASGAARLRYGDLLVLDATGRELCARLMPSAFGVGIEVDDTGATYPVIVDPVLTGPAWTAESDQTSANFGIAVSTAGDVNGDGFSDVIVGSWFYDNGQTDEGRAFVYLGSSSGLGPIPAWTAESDQATAFFGYSVATAGDVNADGYDDVIIGAYLYDNGQTDEGRAFVYLGSNSGLSASPAWTGESDQLGAQFGVSVAAAGDVNGDGYGDVIVGALRYDNGESDEGRAFVYHGSSSGLSAGAAWTGESNQADAAYGFDVDSAGDVNGDGYADVIIGAVDYDSGQANEGGAFVYQGSSSGLAASAAWMAESDQVAAQFGRSVASAGDVNGDGYGDVIVGAVVYDNGQAEEGRASAYYGSSSGLSMTAAWTAEGDQALANFGISVGTAGDLNGDGYSDVIVGAYLFDNGQTDEGLAFVYLGSSAGLPAGASWAAESDQSGSNFGWSVASAGDVNGDGYSDLIIGAYGFDNGETNEGRAFVYLGHAEGMTSTIAWSGESNQAGARLGVSVASAGDVNGDGYGDVIVGADLYDNGESDEGAAFVYLGSANGLATTAAWIGESDQINAFFGFAVASAGDVNGDGYGDVIVGAYTFDNFQTDEGRAYVYLGSAIGLAAAPAWFAESDQASAFFGVSVASAGDVNGDGFGDVIVGAHIFDNGQTDEGAAFIYTGSATGLSATAASMLESDQPFVIFGYSVATAGDVNGDGFSDVVVGAPYFSGGQSSEGRAYVYLGSPYGASNVPAWTAESDQANAFFGLSVASAGDVNGDGFSDVIVGALRYDNGQTDEGRAFVYLGSVAGLAASAAWTAEPDLSFADFGRAVSGAGDVNGDGFSDVIVGAPNFNGGQSAEGRAWTYLGSSTGLSGAAAWVQESNQVGALLGFAVASAGDVNGDGFGDVIVGAYQYDNGETSEGAAFVSLGNEGRGSAVLTPQQRRASNAAPIATLGRGDTYDSFRLQLKLAKFPAPATGSDLAFLEWEVKPLGTALDGTGLGRSAVGSPIVAGATLTLNELVTGLTAPLPYHWRARIATDNPLYPHTPWVTLNGAAPIESKFRTLGGVVCPAPFNYCTPSSTTNGCTPVMSSTGTPSSSASSGFTLLATGVEGAKTGLIFYGINGPHTGVWGTGYLCVKAPTQRTPSQSSGGTANACDGVMSIDWLDYMATHNGAVGHPLLEGKTFWAQTWFRDPPAPKTTNFTDGLLFTLCL